MTIIKSKVYIKTDAQNRVIRCEGGYTTPADLSGWIYIDEGTGDRYNLCQSHYFNGGLCTMDGIPRYKLADGKPVLRSEEEIAADRDALFAPLPSRVEVLEAEVTRLRAQNELQAQHQTFLEDCLLEMGNVVYA